MRAVVLFTVPTTLRKFDVDSGRFDSFLNCYYTAHKSI